MCCGSPTRFISRKSAAPVCTMKSGRPSRCSCPCAPSVSWATGRTYDEVIGLRAVTSTDGMTADFYPFEMGFLGRVATRIINEVPRRQPRGV